VAAAGTARGNPVELDLGKVKKETDIACLYHCDFGEPRRYSQMLQNMLNHYSAYEFDPFKLKLVIVAHGAGLKFFLEDRVETPWEKDNIDPELYQRFVALTKYGAEASVQDPQGCVSQVRALGSGNRGRIAGKGIRLHQGRMKPGAAAATASAEPAR
jgi:intracellular sulfur oxidation DsrE/DsrF family protein